jgi:glycine/sarcosine N-methyltransferase
MMEQTASFYDSLATHYHLIFEDWERAIARQAASLDRVLGTQLPGRLRILDCACGIGTQALGLAALGHSVLGSDLSAGAIARAKKEAAARNLEIRFRVADITTLDGIAEREFDVVAALDNALPHLTGEQLRRAATAMASKLQPGGLLIASIRDYDRLIDERPEMQPPAFYGAPGSRRIVHQIWDWEDRARYTLHLYLTLEREAAWTNLHFVSGYRAVLRDELSSALQAAGLEDVRWIAPAESGFYQPIIIARRP